MRFSKILGILALLTGGLCASDIRSDEVRGASFLTTLGAVPFTTATVGVVNQSKLTCTGGNPGTCLLYDNTAMTGVSGFTVRAGDNQGANYLFSLTSATGTALGGINADNTIYRLGGITAAFPALKRNAAGIDFRTADDLGNTTANGSAFLLGGNPLLTPGLGITTAGGANISWTVSADTAYLATNAAVQSATMLTCVDAGASDDYACNILPALAGYPAGNNILQLWLTPNTTNTTDARLSVQALGLKKILKHNGQALATGDMRAGTPYWLVWDAGGDGGAGAFMLSSLTGNPPASEVLTLTNKTIDVEGTGNVLTTVSYLTIPGFSFKLPTALAPAIVSIEGTNTILDTLEWPEADGNYSAQFAMPLPPDWDAGTVVAAIRWAPAAAATGNVVWQLATTCVAPGEAIDKAYNAVQTVTSAAPAGTEFVDAAIASVTMTGCAPNEEWWLKILRNRTHASDTLNQKPQLNWLQLKVRRAQ